MRAKPPNARNKKNMNKNISTILIRHRYSASVSSTKICSYSLTPLLAIKINSEPMAKAVHRQIEMMKMYGSNGIQIFSHKKIGNTK